MDVTEPQELQAALHMYGQKLLCLHMESMCCCSEGMKAVPRTGGVGDTASNASDWPPNS